ncbi:MAG: hypothetical protein R3F55_22595 [Alphaproteobacteria bacterium]
MTSIRRAPSRRYRTSLVAAIVAGATLAACVPVAGPAQTAGDFATAPAYANPPGFGPAPAPFGGNGWWTVPPGFQLSFRFTSSEGSFSAGVLSSGSSDWYLVYDDGTRLAWGRMGDDGVLRGTWVRAGGPVPCLFPVPPAAALAANGFQFHQPLTVWGTFEARFQAGQDGSVFEGSWGGCGLPLGMPWSGRVA